MRRMIRMLIVVGSVVVVGACSKFLNKLPVAAATLNDDSGQIVGSATLSQDANGLVHVHVEISCPTNSCKSVLPGDHGLHFHAVGSCVSGGNPVFASAGGHFNPLAKQHGLSNPAGPHAGDAPNITVNSTGHGDVRFTTDRITLTPGASSLFDVDGTALVIHAGPDDQMSQPAGNSGARVACGVVK